MMGNHFKASGLTLDTKTKICFDFERPERSTELEKGAMVTKPPSGL